MNINKIYTFQIIYINNHWLKYATIWFDIFRVSNKVIFIRLTKFIQFFFTKSRIFNAFVIGICSLFLRF